MDPPKVPRSLIERVLHDGQSGLRLLHDLPILTDVWAAFAADPMSAQSLLLSPGETVGPPAAALQLARRLKAHRSLGEARPPAYIAPLQGFVTATLTFDEVIFVLCPLLGIEWQLLEPGKAAAVLRQLRPLGVGRHNPTRESAPSEAARTSAVITLIAASTHFQGPVADFESAAEALIAVGRSGVDIWGAAPERAAPPAPTPPFRRATLNRPLQPMGWESVRTIKADAARQVFQPDCSKLVWAVIDSGIDATHDAFRDRSATPRDPPTRVISSYDFSRLRRLTSYDILLDPDGEALKALSAEVKQWREQAPDDPAAQEDGAKPLSAKELLAQLARDAEQGRQFSWTLLEPVLRIPSDTKPLEPHGTHVAGVLAGDWPEEAFFGVCRDIRLMDIRVLGSSEEETESSIIGALEFIRWLNLRNRYRVVQGVNLSIGMKHDVRNWACGQTPVCVACDDLVASGVVVVAAAGNDGWQSFLLSEQGSYEGYAAASIMDPGNAERVITVGATHREKPHVYGVSFFSSRGPTGDGRMKPDLVAPGEKVNGPLPDQSQGLLDGTSMAAPHVSGVAALLMARHNELQGDPSAIKQILMDTATPLGRERSFEGAGLVDALRALQRR
jgi:hypothetical protein